MTILSSSHSSRIRNRSMGVLHLIAADESCEVSDILALLIPEPQPTSTPAVQEHIDDTVSNGLVERPTSPPGAEGSAVPAPIPAQTIRAKIARVHAEHPEWPSKLIANHLGIAEDAVRATASRKGLKLVSWWDYQRTLPPEQRTVPAKPKTAPTNRDRVREAHAANPDMPAKELAFQLGMDELNVRAVATQIGLKLPKMRKALQPRPAEAVVPPAEPSTPVEPEAPPASIPARAKPPTLADKIRGHLVDHPDATLAEVTEAIGGRMQSIGWAAQKAGIVLRKRTAEERSEASAKGAQARTKPVSAPDDEAIQPDETVMPDAQGLRKFRPKSAPTGRFYLRDKDGRYAHQSLQASPIGTGPLMTTDRKWAWFDTMDRYRGAKKLWPELATMRKEGARP